MIDETLHIHTHVYKRKTAGFDKKNIHIFQF